MSSVMCAMPHFHFTQPSVNLAKLQCLFREAGWAAEVHPVVAKVNVMKLPMPKAWHVLQNYY